MKTYEDYIKQKEKLDDIEQKMFDEMSELIISMRKYIGSNIIFDQYVDWGDGIRQVQIVNNWPWIHICEVSMYNNNDNIFTVRKSGIFERDNILKKENLDKLKRTKQLIPLYKYFFSKEMKQWIESKKMDLL